MRLLAAKLALAPLLLWQGARVRSTALRLPEAAGPREGASGQGGLKLRLLIVGDSSGAGVGAAHQDEALAGRLAQALARRFEGRIEWQLIASSGHTSGDALAAMEAALLRPADVLVTALGVNDAVAQLPPRRWLDQLARIDTLARERAGVRYTLHSAVPPMGEFPLLPQPLRWLMGEHANRLNTALSQDLTPDRAMQSLPAELRGARAAAMMAEDGFHPNPAGYALWAETLAERLKRAVPPIS